MDPTTPAASPPAPMPVDDPASALVADPPPITAPAAPASAPPVDAAAAGDGAAAPAIIAPAGPAMGDTATAQDPAGATATPTPIAPVSAPALTSAADVGTADTTPAASTEAPLVGAHQPATLPLATTPGGDATTPHNAAVKQFCLDHMHRAQWLLDEDVCANLAGDFAWWLLVTVMIGLVLWRPVSSLWRALKARQRGTGSGAAAPASPTLPPETLTRLRDLLLGLPRWDDEATRRMIVTCALGKGHPVMQNIAWFGPARQTAVAIIDACADGHAPGTSAPALCALLTGIARDYGGQPARDAELAALRQQLGCD